MKLILEYVVIPFKKCPIIIFQLENLTLPRKRGKNLREIKELQRLLHPFEQAMTNCKLHGSSSFDCSDSRGR